MTEKELLWYLGQKIKRLRTEKGISQISFSEMIGIENSNLSRIESGRTNPTYTTLNKIATALEISLSDLVSVD
ncbi:MAG: helix-turn-helix transcriptional regulator [Chitinophagales bacterium]|nr:helix-turn-helix transcriptional regulator [Chitinophagales bacterium]